jgi:hypothetical protein
VERIIKNSADIMSDLISEDGYISDAISASNDINNLLKSITLKYEISVELYCSIYHIRSELILAKNRIKDLIELLPKEIKNEMKIEYDKHYDEDGQANEK